MIGWYDKIKDKLPCRHLFFNDRKYKLIYDNTFEFIGLCDPYGKLLDVNQPALDAVNAKFCDVVNKPFWDAPWWSTESTRLQLIEAFDEVQRTKHIVRLETTHPDPAGGFIYVDFSLTPVFNKKGEIKYIIPEGRDETTYQTMMQGFENLYSRAPIGFATNDLDTGRFIHANQAFCDLVGYTEVELMALTYWDLTPEEYDSEEQTQLDDMNIRGAYGPYEKRYIHRDGYHIPVLLSGTVADSSDGSMRIWSIVQDLSVKKKAEKDIYQLAYYDPLTGLPNRTHFVDHGKVILDRALKNNHQFGFFLIDVDDFKRINDTRGHAYGDLVLQKIAEKIKHCVAVRCYSEKDCKCFSARLGGDEFVMILENIEDVLDAENVANDVLKEFSTPSIIEGHTLNISVSVGVAIYPESGRSISTLLKAADLALYAAKEKGKNQYYFHDKSLTTKIDELVEYEKHIRYFVDTEDFDVHFQAIFDVELDRVIGAETLFRSNEKKFGPLNLQTVISVAEQTGLIVPLGAAIFKRACEECAKCDILGPDRVNSVNVSTRQLEDSDFVNMCCRTMDAAGVAPHNMAIEVTESMLMGNPQEAYTKLLQLQELGMQVFIDDFGKGFSSMTYLRHLPADKLKIDKAFIDDITTDNTAVEIVRGVNNLAHSIGLTTCAEGVETQAQLNVLKGLGIDQVQGYIIGRPVSATEFKCPPEEQKNE